MGCSASTVENPNLIPKIQPAAVKISQAHCYCYQTKLFIENICFWWVFDCNVDLNQDVLSVIVKYTLTEDNKENIQRPFRKKEFEKYIELKIVIEGGRNVGKSLFGEYLCNNKLCLNSTNTHWNVKLNADNVPFNIEILENQNLSWYKPNIVNHAPHSTYRPPPDVIFILFESTKYKNMLSSINEWAEYIDGMCIPKIKYLKIIDYSNNKIMLKQYIKKCETQIVIVGTKLDQLAKIEHEYESEIKLEKICEKIWEKCKLYQRIHFGGFVSSTTGKNINIVLFETLKRLLKSTSIESCVLCGSHFEPHP